MTYDVFRSNISHQIKQKGDVQFIEDILWTDEVRRLLDEKQYLHALYLLACVDYLSRINDIPLCMRYNDIRCLRLKETLWPKDLLILEEVTGSSKYRAELERTAIPEFKRFNIMENNVRDAI